MLVFLLMMLIIGSGALANLTYRQHLKIREWENHNALPVNAGQDDEEVVNYLEASATVSPTAQRLLATLQGSQKILAAHAVAAMPASPSGPPAWAHDTNANIPATERWALFLADLDREPDDEEVAKVVINWLKAGERFTLWERGKILDRIEDYHYRNMVRGHLVAFDNADAKEEAA